MLSLMTNLSALTAENNLNNANNALSTSLQRLSSGLSINSGADNPSGLVISQEQQAQIGGLQTAISNTSTAVNVVQIADGALNETSSLLQQVRSLAVNAANSGANDANSLAADQAQIANALSTISRIASSTQFGSDQLLNGSHAASTAVTGTNASSYSATSTGTVTTGNYGVNVTNAATAAHVIGGAFVGGQAETLTINGANIQVGANDNVYTVANNINAATANTGVEAVVYGNGTTTGALALYSTQFGSGHTISVQTSAGSADTTGLDPTKTTGSASVTSSTAFNATAAVGSAPAGVYQVALTGGTASNATGTWAGSGTGGAIGTGGTLTITGTSAATITLTAGETEAQVINAINGNTSTTDVAAVLNGGNISLYSTKLGTGTFTVAKTGTDETGLSTATVTAGTSIAGTINGVAATPSGGNVLTAANGLAVTFTVPTPVGSATSVTGNATPWATVNGDQAWVSVGAATDGTDIKGSINGVAATGSGNVLSGQGTASGLTVTVGADTTPSTAYSSTTANPFTSDANSAVSVNVNASNALVFQIGANAGQSTSLAIQSAAASALGQGVSSVFTNLSQINVTQSANINDALNVIDKAISDVANLSGQLGAFQDNTLQATAANLQTSLQNTTAANSAIRDTNFATETANYTQDSVLVQAGTQVLKNANQLPSLVLTLLQ